VGVDERGLRTDELARLLRARRVKLLFTTPAVQSPTGVALVAERRRELLALADAWQLPIVEDDYDSELRYGNPPVPALKNLDAAGRVVYVGTFSKAIFGGLRLGYVVAAQPLLARLALARLGSDLQGDVVTQAAVADLLASGALERHVRRVRRLYAARLAAMEAALVEHLPEDARWRRPAGGNTLWITLPSRVDPDRLLASARAAGIAYTRGDAFHLDPRQCHGMSLCFANTPEPLIAAGVGELGELIRACSRGGGRRRG
jgi:GntR family transcriptional regulator/MocR family aminotransferase